MKVLVFVISITTIFVSCKSKIVNSKNGNVDSLTVNNQAFPSIFSKDTQLVLYSGKIILPKGWRRAKDDTLVTISDATVRCRFHNNSGKLIYLQYGLGTIGNPSEPNVLPAIFRKGYVRNNADTSDIIFTDNPKLPEIRARSNYLYSSEKISDFQATFFKPKHVGIGYTGFYIDSIGQIASNIADLILYSENLDSLETMEFERVARSLVIKDFN